MSIVAKKPLDWKKRSLTVTVHELPEGATDITSFVVESDEFEMVCEVTPAATVILYLRAKVPADFLSSFAFQEIQNCTLQSDCGTEFQEIYTLDFDGTAKFGIFYEVVVE